jgi:hypothetical protein
MLIYLNSLHTKYSRYKLNGLNTTGKGKEDTGSIQSG